MKKFLSLLAILFFNSSLLFSGVTGKISGHVSDKETKDALIGAIIQIEGTTLGSISDNGGDFHILNVPVGVYRVKFSFIGYGNVIYENVRVKADFTTRLEATLVTESLQFGEVLIEAKRELIQRDATSTVAVIEFAEIKALPIETMTQALTLNAGIVESKNRGGSDDGIHLRGGRTGEISYVIDGVVVDNPLFGGLSSDVSRLGVSSLTILSGTFNAEYGQAQSGIINIITQEGSENFSGTLRIVTDEFGGDENNVGSSLKPLKFNNWKSLRKELVLSGGVPTLEDKINFFLSLEDYKTNSYLNKILGPEYKNKAGDSTIQNHFDFGLFEKNIKGNVKLTFRLFDQIKLQVGGIFTRKNDRSYDHYFKELPLSNGQSLNTSDLINIYLTHAVNENTFYDIRYSYFDVANQYFFIKDQISNDKSKRQTAFNSLMTYVSSSNAFGGTSNYEFAGHYDFSVPVVYAIKYQYNLAEDIYTANDSLLFSAGTPVTEAMQKVLNDTSITKFDKPILMVSIKATSMDNYYSNARSITRTLMSNFSTQINKTNELKMGFEIRNHNISNHIISGVNDYWNFIEDPNDPNYMDDSLRHYEVTKYEFNPTVASFYMQDKMEISDLVMNIGFRFDYINVDAVDVYRAFRDPNISAADLKTNKIQPKSNISPRIGLAFPITENTKFHGSYGQFYQFPDFNFLYRRFNQLQGSYPVPQLGTSTPRIGNPNLNPEKTNAFEFGVETILSEDLVSSVTIFYKDTYDYIATTQKRLGSSIYFEYANLDYANSRGIEFSLKKRISNHFGYMFSYTFSRAEGNADNSVARFNQYINESVLGTILPKRTVTLSWDQPHTLSFSSTFAYDEWGISFIGQYGSGMPFTPTDARGSAIGDVNSQRQPWTGTIDSRLYKTIKLLNLNVTGILDVQNIFDKRNIINVFTNTGTPDFSLNPNVSPENLQRPYYYGQPRHIQLGVEVEF